MSDMQHFGRFGVYIAAVGPNKGKPLIDDGCYGECYQGDSAGARELAADLIAAADAYDALAVRSDG